MRDWQQNVELEFLGRVTNCAVADIDVINRNSVAELGKSIAKLVRIQPRFRCAFEKFARLLPNLFR